MTQRLFSDREFYRKVLRISIPAAFQSLMLSLVAAADAFMLGRLEQNAMAAVSLATQIQFVQNIIVYGIVGTTSILGAQYWGKGDRKSLRFIFALSLKLSVCVSLIFSVACISVPRELMLIFTNEEELVRIGIGYLKIAGWSYFITGISQVYMVMMKVSEHAFLSALISTCTVIINILLNAVFIFGLFSLPPLGANGAALSTLISRIIECAWCLIVFLGKDFVRVLPKDFMVKNKLLAKDFFANLLPLVGASIFWGVGFTSYSAFMGHMGKDAAAANSVAAVVRDLVCCLCNGLATGAGIVVGGELGAGNLAKAKTYGNKLFLFAFILGFISTAIMLLLTPAVMNFVHLSKNAKHLLLGMMFIMSFYMIGRTINTIVINGIFDCGGDTLFDVYSLAVFMWVLAIPLAALGTFVFHWNPLVVYACTCLDEVGKIPWVIAHFKKYKWVKDLTR